MKNAKICIVVPVRRYSGIFEKCLESLSGLDYPDFEIIIVDDGADDIGSKIQTGGRHRTRVLRSGSKGPSYARNLAAASTDAEYLAFTDSDCIVDKGWLGKLLEGFLKYPDAVSCGGSQRLPEDSTGFERKVYAFMQKVGFLTEYMRRPDAPAAGIIEVMHNASCCAMYRRDIFIGEKGFLEGLWPGEDVELDYRLKKKGFKIVFNPDAKVYHYRPKDLKLFLNMMFRYGLAQGILVRKYGIFRKIQRMPFVIFFAAFFMVLAYSINPYLVLLSCIFIGISFLAWLKFDICMFFLSFLALTSWNLGFLRGILKLK